MAAINTPFFRQVVDTHHGGPHSTEVGFCTLLTENGTPVRRRVRLHDEPTGRPIREMWSEATSGAWQFLHIRAGRYTAVGYDHTGAKNGEVITGIVVPKP